MKRLSISVVFIACLVILVIKVAAQQQESLYRGSEHRHANFVEHPRAFLDVSAIAIKRVHDALYCAFNCLRKGRCFSFNVAVFPDADGKYECQLLATDKYSSSHNLKSTKEFNHHSILVREIKACHGVLSVISFSFLFGVLSLLSFGFISFKKMFVACGLWLVVCGFYLIKYLSGDRSQNVFVLLSRIPVKHLRTWLRWNPLLVKAGLNLALISSKIIPI